MTRDNDEYVLIIALFWDTPNGNVYDEYLFFF